MSARPCPCAGIADLIRRARAEIDGGDYSPDAAKRIALAIRELERALRERQTEAAG